MALIILIGLLAAVAVLVSILLSVDRAIFSG